MTFEINGLDPDNLEDGRHTGAPASLSAVDRISDAVEGGLRAPTMASWPNQDHRPPVVRESNEEEEEVNEADYPDIQHQGAESNRGVQRLDASARLDDAATDSDTAPSLPLAERGLGFGSGVAESSASKDEDQPSPPPTPDGAEPGCDSPNGVRATVSTPFSTGSVPGEDSPSASAGAPPPAASVAMADSANSTSKTQGHDTETALADLRHFADDLVARGTQYPMVYLRLKKKQLGLPLPETELKEILQTAVDCASIGQLRPHRGGEIFNATPTEWLLPGVLIKGVLNLLVGTGKVGKTYLMLGLLEALSRCEITYLGLPITGPCPPVLLVGTDMSAADWRTMLLEAELMRKQPDGSELLHEAITEMYDSGQAISLNQAGISAIAAWCACNPGGLVILDSAASLTRNLGLSENARGFARPFDDLMKAVTPHGATVILFHHTTKEEKGFDPARACRGTSALPATASQLVGLFHYPTPKGSTPDRRIVLSSTGRGGAPLKLVIEQDDATSWLSHGRLVDVLAVEKERTVRLNLNDRQYLAYTILEERHRTTLQMQSAAEIKPYLPATFVDPDGRFLRRAFEQLEAKGLVEILRVTTLAGHENRYGSKAVQRQIDSGELTSPVEENEPATHGGGAPAQPSAGSAPPSDEFQAVDPNPRSEGTDLPEVADPANPAGALQPV